MTGDPAKQQLRRELGGRKALYLERLSSGQLQALLTDVQAAKRHEAELLHQAIDRGMAFLPILLRVPLKRILFPND